MKKKTIIIKKNNLSTYSDFLTYRCSCISVITGWRSFIQMVIIQMAHIVNNHIIMTFYIDCINTDICEQSVITCWLSAIQMVIIQIQAIPHKTRKHIWKLLKKKERKRIICAKSRSLSYAPIRWQVRHSVRHASSRGSTRIQINNFLCIFDFFFFLDDLILFGTLPATKSCCFFFPPRRCFWT